MAIASTSDFHRIGARRELKKSSGRLLGGESA